MKLPIYNKEGEIVKEIEIPKEFDIEKIKVSPDLIHQVAVALYSNQRSPIAHTKTRSEVRGGGRKPWRQKGLGRARHGSIRSPIWRKGGVVFGPRNERNYKKDIPRKMKRRAFQQVLALKIKDGELFLVDDLKMDEIKTKNFQKILNNLPLNQKTILLVSPDARQREYLNLVKSARNIKNVKISFPQNINLLDLLNAKFILTEPKVLEIFREKVKIEK